MCFSLLVAVCGFPLAKADEGSGIGPIIFWGLFFVFILVHNFLKSAKQKTQSPSPQESAGGSELSDVLRDVLRKMNNSESKVEGTAPSPPSLKDVYNMENVSDEEEENTEEQAEMSLKQYPWKEDSFNVESEAFDHLKRSKIDSFDSSELEVENAAEKALHTSLTESIHPLPSFSVQTRNDRLSNSMKQFLSSREILRQGFMIQEILNPPKGLR